MQSVKYWAIHFFAGIYCVPFCLGPPFNRDLPTRNMNQSAPQSIGTADSMQGMYNHLGRSDSIGSAHSVGGMSLNSESNLSYNHLERLPSWGSQASYHGQRGEQYNRLNPVPSESNIQEGSYDRLARSPSTTSRTLVQSLVSTDHIGLETVLHVFIPDVTTACNDSTQQLVILCKPHPSLFCSFCYNFYWENKQKEWYQFILENRVGPKRLQLLFISRTSIHFLGQSSNKMLNSCWN